MSSFIPVFSWIYSGTLGFFQGSICVSACARQGRAGLLSLRNFEGPRQNNSVLLSAAALAVRLSNFLPSPFFLALRRGAHAIGRWHPPFSFIFSVTFSFRSRKDDRAADARGAHTPDSQAPKGKITQEKSPQNFFLAASRRSAGSRLFFWWAGASRCSRQLPRQSVDLVPSLDFFVGVGGTGGLSNKKTIGPFFLFVFL
nr:hypothetical protein [Pandoravirus belohorizontensis]